MRKKLKRAKANSKPQARGRSLHRVVRLSVHFFLCTLWLASEALVFLMCIPLFVVIELHTFAYRQFHKQNHTGQARPQAKEQA